MEIIYKLFGEGKDLNVLQMCMRALVMFIFTLIIIRIAGRRSFGMKMPFDNIITILLGAILSRAVAGASPFFPTIAAATLLAILHRVCAWLAMKSDSFGRLLKGNACVLFKDGRFLYENMDAFQVCEKDMLEMVRIDTNLPDFEKVKEIYMERTGELGIVKKEE
ncbi:MAG: hypothetical protein JWN78_3130 [Bacteroidota bacterium]|nr:hypothetical protein [Bacteroidota bacterium]